MCCENIKPLLSAFVDGALDEGEERKVKEHLAACEACAAEEHLLCELSHEVRSMPFVKAPPGFADALREKMDAHDAGDSPESNVISSSRIRSFSRFRRPVWLGVAASFILAGVTIAFLIVSQIEMHSLSENSMAAPDKRQVADHTPVTELEPGTVKQLEALGYGSAPAGKSDGASGPGALKRIGKGPRESTLRESTIKKNAKGPRAETVYNADQDMPAATRLLEDDALDAVPVERPEKMVSEEILSEEMPAVESEAGIAKKETIDGFVDIEGEMDGLIATAAISDLILVVDAEEWRMPKHLVAMANSTGQGIMDFSAPIDFPGEKSEAIQEQVKRKSGDGGKGLGKGPGSGGVGGVAPEEAGENKIDRTSREMKDEIGGDKGKACMEWVCVYLDADVNAIPELFEDLALTPGTKVWKGTLTPSEGVVDEDEERVRKPFAGYEVSVSRIPWIDDLVAMGCAGSAPGGTAAPGTISGVSPGKNRAKTITVGNKTFPDDAKAIETMDPGIDSHFRSDDATGRATPRRRILIIFPKKALDKKIGSE